MSEEIGQGMTEYALIISFVALLVFGAVKVLGEEITSLLNRAVDALKNEVAA
jgi:Flp pilus assembly pilin Flp